MYRGVTKLWTPPVVYVYRARNNLSFYVCLSLHPVQSTPFSPPFSKLQRRRPTHWQCPPYPRSFLGLGLDLGLIVGVCLGWCLHCAIAFLTHPPSLIASLSISHQFLLDSSRSNWTNIWVRPLLSNFFKILPLALPWSTSPTLCLTKHQIQIFITLKKGQCNFFFICQNL